MAQNTFAWPDGTRAALSLTFDDARPSQVEKAVPLLNEFGLHATFYVSPARMESRIELWREAVATGHEIGNHTNSHPCSGNFPFSRSNALEDYTLERLERDILDANETILAAAGAEARTFAYPCGQKFVGRGEKVQSYVPVISKHFLVGRGAFDETHNDPSFVDLAQVAGVDADSVSFETLRAMVEQTVAAGGWLVLFGHEVGETARQTVHLDALARLCELVANPRSGVWCDTVLTIGAYVDGSR
jgi:peptidoglycan-N-acetylglucosamine deacetylase